MDDTGPQGTWSPRVVEIRGTAATLPDEHPVDAFQGVQPGVIRISPQPILSYVDGTGHNRTVRSS